MSLSSKRFPKWAGQASFYRHANLPAWWYIIFIDDWESSFYTSKSHTHVLWWHHICRKKSSIDCSYVYKCIKLSITLIATCIGSIVIEQNSHRNAIPIVHCDDANKKASAFTFRAFGSFWKPNTKDLKWKIDKLYYR